MIRQPDVLNQRTLLIPWSCGFTFEQCMGHLMGIDHRPTNAGSRPSDLPASTWSVWRQGDDGNAFQIEAHLAEAAARQRVAHYESLGHKQFYWAQQDVPARPAGP